MPKRWTLTFYCAATLDDQLTGETADVVSRILTLLDELEDAAGANVNVSITQDREVSDR